MSSPIVVPVALGGAASSATLASLAKSIAKWLNRTDLAEVIPDFVRMAESEFARDTRIASAFQTAQASGYTESGEFPLPADMLQLKELKFEGSPMVPMAYEDWRNVLSGPYFTRVGNVVHVTGKPNGNYTLTYVQRLPQLEMAADSNWLLRNHYDIYLWKCCELGSVWMRDAEAATGYNTKYELAVSHLVSANNEHQWGGAQLVVQAPGVV